MGYLITGLLSFAAGAVVFYFFGKRAGVKAAQLLAAVESAAKDVERAAESAAQGFKRAL